MADQITDCKITKVYPGPTGRSEHGDWEMYNFYVNGDDKIKFTWFGGEKRITPVEGMEIAYMEYEKVTKGQYTNLNVKKLVLKEDSTPQAIPNTKEDMGGRVSVEPTSKDRAVYASYAKDIADAIIVAGGNLETADLDAMVRKIAKAGLIMMNESLNSVPIPSEEPKKAPPVQDDEKPIPQDTQNQADKELTATLKGFAKENNEEYFKVLGLHGASNAEEVLGFEKEARQSLLRDLEKAFKMPF